MIKKEVVERKNVFLIEPSGDKFHVSLNGAVIHRAKSMSAANETIRKRRDGMANVEVRLHPNITAHTALTGGEYITDKPLYSVDQRFRFLQVNTRLVANGHANSMVVLGEGGLGKTWTVVEELRTQGFRDLSDLLGETEVGGVIPGHLKRKSFVKMTGFSTAKALFRFLFEHNDMVMILDDCDNVQKDDNATNIMKAALDTLEKRRVYWNAEEPPGGTDLPRAFDFTGRIIFLSNLSPDKLNQAFTTRALRVDVTMNKEEIIQRMHWILDTSDKFLPDIAHARKKEALKLIEDIQDQIPMKRFSLRALIHACKMANSGEEDWRELATYTLTSR